MSATVLTIDVDSRQLDDLLLDLYDMGRDPQSIYNAIGMEMKNRVRDRFDTMTDPMGEPWAPWKPATVKTYPKDANHRLLDRFGEKGMLGSLSHVADANSAEIGFGQPYAAHHEFGTDKMARRGLLFADPENGALSTEDETALLDIATRAFEQVIG